MNTRFRILAMVAIIIGSLLAGFCFGVVYNSSTSCIYYIDAVDYCRAELSHCRSKTIPINLVQEDYNGFNQDFKKRT